MSKFDGFFWCRLNVSKWDGMMRRGRYDELMVSSLNNCWWISFFGFDNERGK